MKNSKPGTIELINFSFYLKTKYNDWHINRIEWYLRENLNEKRHSFILFSDAYIIVLFVHKCHRELKFFKRAFVVDKNKRKVAFWNSLGFKNLFIQKSNRSGQ
jgi:hypothetical protein